MKKVALLLGVCVLAPSLVLAWLAVRSLRDQEYLLQRQQSVVYQAMADNLARDVQKALDDAQRDFKAQVSTIVSTSDPRTVSGQFDQELRRRWPLAQIGFVVNRSGALSCPLPNSGPEASQFCANYGTFLTCRETAEVYWNNPKQVAGFYGDNGGNSVPAPNAPAEQSSLSKENSSSVGNSGLANGGNAYEFKTKGPVQRNVLPMQQAPAVQQQLEQPAYSKFAASEAEFCQLTSSSAEGTLARFVDNKLSVLFWCRPAQSAAYVFGAQLSVPKLAQVFGALLTNIAATVNQQVCVAVLDDTTRPVALSRTDFKTGWKRPFVASEVGEALPHWEVAVYLLDPAKLQHSARISKLTLGLLIAVLLVAIGAGSWVVVADLNRQLGLARQKTDFVSNVSHELKTPLTSIRMFSELLAEGRVTDPAKQRSYLAIITAEAARLTRLINNVLDFARIERHEKRYQLEKCDVTALAREAADMFRPHLEANGFTLNSALPGTSVEVACDRDAIAQVLVNLLSNAEKYSGDRKEISIGMRYGNGSVEIQVMDRGMGIPSGAEEKIFEQFYRAHDSLSSGIPGTGLGLTLARQIARAHGGDVTCSAREGGGSRFTLRLPCSQEKT